MRDLVFRARRRVEAEKIGGSEACCETTSDDIDSRIARCASKYTCTRHFG